VLEVNDQGAIYYGRDPSEQGIVVRYNVIENIPDNYITAAIYHDDGACGLTAYSNIFINAGQRNVLVGGGSNNIYFNNLFVGRKHAVFIDNRLASWLKGLTPRDNGLFAKRLQAVHYQDSTYATHYPGLVYGSAGWGYGWGGPWGWYNPWGWYGYGGYSYPVGSEKYRYAHLIVEAIDRKTNSVVWQARGSSEINTPEKSINKLPEVVNGIFKQYPLKKKK